jgi:predicted MFS family arabinose efflux permease
MGVRDAGSGRAAGLRGESSAPGAGRLAAAALVATTAGVLPVFLAGGLAVQIRADLGFGPAALGLVVTGFFAVAALSSTPAGHLVERIGTYRGIVLAAGFSATSLLGVAVLARQWWTLAAFVALGGLSNGTAQPAANLLLARGFPRHRQGLAFGVKQAAIPAATLIAGAAVPALGLTVGWRWAFVAATLWPLSLPWLAPRGVVRRRRRAEAPRLNGVADLLFLGLVAALGTASATALGAFLVDAAVVGGFAPASAGLLLSICSGAGVLARVVVGWQADIGRFRDLDVVAGMLIVGAGAFLVLAGVDRPEAFALGSIIGFAAGWGWNGVLVHAVVRRFEDAPAAATGITQTGLYLGGMAGPLAFGVVAERGGYDASWLLGAAMLGAAALLAVVSRRAHERRDGDAASPPERGAALRE